MTAFSINTILFLIILGSNTIASTPSKLTVHFFGSATCGECAEIKETLLLPLQKRFPQTFDLRIHDIETDSGFLALARFEE